MCHGTKHGLKGASRAGRRIRLPEPEFGRPRELTFWDITPNGATLTNSSATLLKASTAAAADDPNVNSSWGTVTFTASNQTLTGAVLIMDSTSSVDMALSGSSILTGGFNTKNLGAAILALHTPGRRDAGGGLRETHYPRLPVTPGPVIRTSKGLGED